MRLMLVGVLFLVAIEGSTEAPNEETTPAPSGKTTINMETE